MKDFLNRLINSLDTHSKGFSGRKLSAMAIIICVIGAHIKWYNAGNFEQLVSVLTVDYGFVSVLFGLTTYSSVKKLNNDETPQT